MDSGVPSWANYRPSDQPGVDCSSCDFFVAARCEMFDYTTVKADYVCDRWEGTIEKDDNPQSLIDLIEALEPTYKADGQEIMGWLTKGQSHAAVLHLRVNGVSRTPSGGMSYRMVTRDGHYVGRTNPTKVRARKGDVLKVQANDFLQNANGDYQWQNPNVISTYTDSAHSWKELCALAGGDIEKDGPNAGPNAPAPEGDIPPAGDMGASSSMPNGPTLDAVHIPVPLTNISISYGPKKLKYKVQKANKNKQLIYGVVLEPEVLDSQDDFMLPNMVEQAAHNYLKKVSRGKASVSKLQHRRKGFFKDKPSVVPVESFIAPTDFSYDGKEMVKKGTWVMVLHVEDPNVWSDVIAGKYTGLSIGGTGIRQEMTMPQGEGAEGASYPMAAEWFADNGVR